MKIHDTIDPIMMSSDNISNRFREKVSQSRKQQECDPSLGRRVSRTSSPSLLCNLESRPNEFMHLQHIVLH